MKKLFVSVPMRGRTEENIIKSIDAMHKIAELMFEEELVVIDTFDPIAPAYIDRFKNLSMWHLGESIKKMSEADYFIGVWHDSRFPGCIAEKYVADAYKITKYLIRIEDAAFFKDIHEEEVEPVCPRVE